MPRGGLCYHESMEQAAELLPAIYGELRRLAAAQLARLTPGQTLQPTALVHEAYLKLVGDADPGWNQRGHFYGAAAQAMREIIVDHLRRKCAQKRGAGRPALELDSGFHLDTDGLTADEALAIDEALTCLAQDHPRQAQVVVMRFFGGLCESEIAEALSLTTRTVERDWRFARAYLHAHLSERTP